MATVIPNLVEAAYISKTEQGYRSHMTVQVTDLAAGSGPQARLVESYEAMEAAGYITHAEHPIVKYARTYGLVISNVETLRAESWNVLKFKVTYETLAVPKIGGKWYREVHTRPRIENYGLDAVGNRLKVRWKPPTSQNYDWNDAAVQFKFTHGVQAPWINPQIVYIYRRHFSHEQYQNPQLGIRYWPQYWRKKINRQFDDSNGLFHNPNEDGLSLIKKGTIIVAGMQLTSRDRFYTAEVTAELWQDPRGWDAYLWYHNQHNEAMWDVSFFAEGGADLRDPDHTVTEGKEPYGVARFNQYIPANLHGLLEGGGLDIQNIEMGDMYGNP